MSIGNKVRTVFRGDISFATLVCEAVRRRRRNAAQRAERRDLTSINAAPPRLSTSFADLDPQQLLAHFRGRSRPAFWPDTPQRLGALFREHFPGETPYLIAVGDGIVRESTWELAGLGPLNFRRENPWRCDPLGDHDWGLDHHADVAAYEKGGPDIRVLWELNRMGHTISLACAFAATGDEVYAETFFAHIERWMEQNPYGRGANWACAMEVALRAVNLLAAFDIFRSSESCTEERLLGILKLFDQHGRFIRANDEFSHVLTSNHYLSDVVGLFWLGTLLPELEHADDWRQFGRSEMLRETEKQVLPDGADFEASTGYHGFVTQMLLYSALLAERNGDGLGTRYDDVVRSMLEYIFNMRRPDGGIPLVGDADGSQIVPVIKRNSDDQDHLLSVGAAYMNDAALKTSTGVTPELLWLMGEKGMKAVEALGPAPPLGSAAFVHAGSHILRSDDLYLHFNTSDCGANGRGSHGHNDALSVEISAFGHPFVVDPGSYVYNLDRSQRQTFRSTAYHSTVVVDGMEQGTITVDMPFVMGNEPLPRTLEWVTGPDVDIVVGEHSGYRRAPDFVGHRRRIEFHKTEKYWLIKDELDGGGRHTLALSFHLAPGLASEVVDDRTVKVSDASVGCLYFRAVGLDEVPTLLAAYASRSYGHREASTILTWETTTGLPFEVSFLVMPVGPGEKASSRLELLQRLTDNIDK